jgi:mannitol/fructose-specific phosphotransferase system IIA component (Ntr-type)
MTYSELFPPEAILLKMDQTDADEVLEVLANTLILQDPALAGRESELVQALKDRESKGSTGSQGVGIPHVKVEGASKVSAVIGIHQDGVDFNALDGEDVHVFFSVVRPVEGADEHLGLLRWIAGIAQHQDFVSFSCQAHSQKQIVDLLSELATA